MCIWVPLQALYNGKLLLLSFSEISSQSLPHGLAVGRYISRTVSVLGYVAQIVSPPPHLKQLELAAGGKVMGFATNSLSTSTMFSMDKFGGHKLIQPSVYMAACMIRAAAKTLDGFDALHSAIAQAAIDGLALRPAGLGEIIPMGWDSPAFCTSLYNAKRGVIQGWPSPSVQSGLTMMVAQYRNGELKGAFQGKVYKFLHSCIVPDWHDLLNRRALILCVNSVHLLPVQLDSSFEGLYSRICKKCSKTVNTCVIKSWSHSWCTSSRFHESPVLPCIFGCSDQEDMLSHYLSCEPVRTIISSVLRLPAVSIQECPAVRLNLISPSVFKAKVVAMAFHVTTQS